MNIEEERNKRLEKAKDLRDQASKLLFNAKIAEAEAKKFDKIIKEANTLINGPVSEA